MEQIYRRKIINLAIRHCEVRTLIIILSFETEDERDKFEYIYSKYKNLLLYKAYEILKDYALSEDAVSEAFIRIYRNLHKIDDPKSNKAVAFIVTITRNAALTMLKKEKGNVVEEYDETKPDDYNLENHIISEMSSEAVYSMLNGMQEDMRNVFIMKYAYDMTHKEIGRTLGISENNVTVKLHRARKKLAALMIEEGYAYES